MRYRDVSANSQQYNILTVMNPSIESHVVGNLKEYTKYEFFLAPFYQTLEGQPSNSKLVQTYEDGKQEFAVAFELSFNSHWTLSVCVALYICACVGGSISTANLFIILFIERIYYANLKSASNMCNYTAVLCAPTTSLCCQHKILKF